MKILLTNDDGIESEGIKKLAAKLARTEELYVVAPHRKLHGASCSITFDQPVKVQEFPLGLGEKKSYQVKGTPADCVILGLDALASGIKLVISGINDEPNVGDDVRFSGTIGACTEASFSGVSSFGISLEYGREDFDAAVEFSSYLVQFLKKHALAPGVFLNINMPPASLEQIKGVKFVRLGRRRYRDRVHKITSPYGETFYWIGGKQIPGYGKDTLNSALKDNYIAVTPMAVDSTSYDFLKEMINNWTMKFPKF
ncbi:MAG: 5'/3'-nucleotidase SurE [Actinomycetota bacterium]